MAQLKSGHKYNLRSVWTFLWMLSKSAKLVDKKKMVPFSWFWQIFFCTVSQNQFGLITDQNSVNWPNGGQNGNQWKRDVASLLACQPKELFFTQIWVSHKKIILKAVSKCESFCHFSALSIKNSKTVTRKKAKMWHIKYSNPGRFKGRSVFLHSNS